MLQRFILCLFALYPSLIFAQSGSSSDSTDLSQLLGIGTNSKGHDYVTATFKGVRVVNGQSIENEAPGVLNFIICHRFGSVQNGFQDIFGLDNANTRFGVEYGVKNWLTVGLGRSSFEKEYDGYARFKILRQTLDNHMPISLSYAGTIMIKTNPETVPNFLFTNRISYCNQLLVAHKFSDKLSIQLSPTHVHYNLVKDKNDPNDMFALGIGGRIKISKRMAITGEYFYRIPGTEITSSSYHNALSLGVDIETGGHVFQFHFTNATAMSERAFVGQTTDSWSKGGIHLGFNISRVFTIVKPKEFR